MFLFRWWESYRQATSKTKSFIWTWIIYGLVIIVTAVYCYARLDYVRSYDKSKQVTRGAS